MGKILKRRATTKNSSLSFTQKDSGGSYYVSRVIEKNGTKKMTDPQAREEKPIEQKTDPQNTHTTVQFYASERREVDDYSAYLSMLMNELAAKKVQQAQQAAFYYRHRDPQTFASQEHSSFDYQDSVQKMLAILTAQTGSYACFADTLSDPYLRVTAPLRLYEAFVNQLILQNVLGATSLRQEEKIRKLLPSTEAIKLNSQRIIAANKRQKIYFLQAEMWSASQAAQQASTSNSAEAIKAFMFLPWYTNNGQHPLDAS